MGVGVGGGGGGGGQDVDMTVQSFAQWLTEMKSSSSASLSQLLSEMSIIRDGITANNQDLTEFKRHSTSIQTQMQVGAVSASATVHREREREREEKP